MPPAGPSTKALQQSRLDLGRHARPDFLFGQIDGQFGGRALHFEARQFARRFDFLFRLRANARDFGLRFAADALGFAVAFFFRAGAQRRDFLFEIGQLRLHLGGARIGFGFGFFAGREPFGDLLRSRRQQRTALFHHEPAEQPGQNQEIQEVPDNGRNIRQPSG